MRPSSKWQWQQRTATYSFIVKNKHDLPPDWIVICKYIHIKRNFFFSPIFDCQMPSDMNTNKKTYFNRADHVNGKQPL